MQHSRLIFLFASSCLAALGVLAACSDDTAVPLPGGGTSTSGGTSKNNSSSSTSGAPVQGDDDDDDKVVDAGGADCSDAPGLHKTTAGFYCAFYADGGADGGSKSNCLNDETCCNPGKSGSAFPPSFCAHAASKDDNGQATCKAGATTYTGTAWIASGSTTWECGGTSNCTGGRKCCAFSQDGADAGNYVNIGNDPKSEAPAACKAQYVYKIGGSKCADECADDKSELELCSSTDKCSDTTKTCIPAGTTGTRDLGVCK